METAIKIEYQGELNGFAVTAVHEKVQQGYELSILPPTLDHRILSAGSVGNSVTVFGTWDGQGRANIVMVRINHKEGTVETSQFCDFPDEAIQMMERRLNSWLL